MPLELEEVTGLALAAVEVSIVFFEGDLDWFSLAASASDLAICWQLLAFLSVSSSDSL